MGWGVVRICCVVGGMGVLGLIVGWVGFEGERLMN